MLRIEGLYKARSVLTSEALKRASVLRSEGEAGAC
jgi:hypothetical protein